MRPISILTGSLIAGCLWGIASVQGAFGQVSTNDFNDLKSTVEQLDNKVQELEQVHQQDQKVREQNESQIRQLQDQLSQTQLAVTNATEKAEAAAQVQPVHPLPPGPPATHNFTMVGDAEVQFGQVIGSHSAFALADFAPIFLFRGGNDVLFEAGFDIALQNNAPDSPGATTTVDLSFAQLDYLFNDYVTFVGGYMVLPLGTYVERSAGWLNLIPDDPLPVDVIQSSGAGVQLLGSLPVGEGGQMVTYSLYGVNGPSSVNGSGDADQLDLGGNVGINSDDSFGNLHVSPSGGGRIGWFYPWKAHYDLELGVSGQSGPWDNANNLIWSAFVLDASLHVSPYFEVKGEYINTWQQTSDVGTIEPHGWWIQPAFKLAAFDLDFPVINNVQLVGRYDTVNNGQDTWTDRWTVGYVYYFSNTLLFEGDYEFLKSDDPSVPHSLYVFQLSYGF